jgi:hypothetical protein
VSGIGFAVNLSPTADKSRTRVPHRVGGRPYHPKIMSLLPPVGWADVATKQDLRGLEAKLEVKMEAMESRLNERIIRTALVVNIPTILASFTLAFTAVRLGA